MLGCEVQTDSLIGSMETAEMDPAVISSISGPAWGAAAHYRQLIQQQQQQQQQQLQQHHTEDEGAASDAGSAGSRGASPRPDSEPDVEVGDNHRSPVHTTQSVLDKLKQQVEDVTNGRHPQSSGEESPEFRLRDAASLQQQRHRLSPQSLLAASMAAVPPSLVPLPGLTGLTGYGGGGVGRAGSVSPPAREAPSPPTSSAGHSPRGPSGTNQASWNFEEQFKQLYEIDDNPKRKEFLDELFRFMQERGTPINRLPIMAKQVLDMYELYNLVVAQGGLVQVINKKLWQEIIKGLKLPSSITSAAFTLRTQYMKYLYPYECHKQGLSSPSELQTAIDGNKREGRRSTYTNSPYAELMQRSPMMNGYAPMGPSFGLGNGMPLPTTLHQQGLSPLSLVTSRAAAPGSNGPTGHPMPPSSPFLPGMVPPGLPTPNDTLMTLWSLYNSRQAAAAASPPPGRRFEAPPPPAAPPAVQSEALNLGVHRELNRSEKDREHRRSHDNGAPRERKRPTKRERQEMAAAQRLKKAREEGDDIKTEGVPHTKTTITQNGDSSMVLSMEMNGVVYQGVLFAQPKTARV